MTRPNDTVRCVLAVKRVMRAALCTVRPALLFSAVCLFFFFSSRRRHTRSDRDWSSDVCSSDLAVSADNDLSRCGFLATGAAGLALAGEAKATGDAKQPRLRSMPPVRTDMPKQIGRASCRERV